MDGILEVLLDRDMADTSDWKLNLGRYLGKPLAHSGCVGISPSACLRVIETCYASPIRRCARAYTSSEGTTCNVTSKNYTNFPKS
jgi:hypothetical protein